MGRNDEVEHVHNEGHRQEYRHVHAWGSTPHNHFARAVCNRPECEGFATHNIHAGPS